MKSSQIVYTNCPPEEGAVIELKNESKHVVTTDSPHVIGRELNPGDRFVITGGGTFVIRKAKRYWGKVRHFRDVLYRKAD